MAEEDPLRIEEAVIRAFSEFPIAEGSSLLRVLVGAYRWAKVENSDAGPGDTGGEIVIDRLALFKALVADGIAVRDTGYSSAWLVAWLRGARIDPEGLLTLDFDRRARPDPNQPAGPLVASATLRNKVFPGALTLARETGTDGALHLRHVHFALLRDLPVALFGPAFTEDQKQRLLLEFAARNGGDEPWLRFARGDRPATGSSTDETAVADVSPGETPAPPEAGSIPPRPPPETVATHSDAPSLIDKLGRAPFAQVLAERIRGVLNILPTGRITPNEQRDRSFILHLHGPWGSGKSTILNLLAEELRKSEPPWLVVEFNAWQNQQRRPSWWPIIATFYDSARRTIGWLRGWRIWQAWLIWRARMAWKQLALALGLIALAILAAISTARTDSLSVETIKSVVALLAGIGSLITLARTIGQGATKSLESHLENRAEPFRPMYRLFLKLVLAVKRPVVILVDDLDRCDGAYVTDFLEGLQTLLRAAPVIFVVAGDRKWITTSFERRFADFSADISTPGRPLGYLFVDKLFQLSVSVPRLSGRQREDYWRELLGRTQAGDALAQAVHAEIEAKAVQQLAGLVRHEDIQVVIERAAPGSVEREALQAVAAKRSASPEADREAEHRLQPLASLLEPNPRAMKRLINAYGLNVARAYLEGRAISVEALARWTVVELRWPLLASHIMDRWDEISVTGLDARSAPAHIAALLREPDVLALFDERTGDGGLTRANLHNILA